MTWTLPDPGTSADLMHYAGPIGAVMGAVLLGVGFVRALGFYFTLAR